MEEANHPAAAESPEKLAAATAGRERQYAERERVDGPDHPATLAARDSVARAYRMSGRFAEAIIDDLCNAGFALDGVSL